MPDHLKPQLRLYRRLVLAQIDLDEAKSAVQELLNRRIPLPKNKPADGLLMALTTALIVSYSRPFVNSRGHSEVADKSVPGFLLRTLTSRERSIHEELISLRNKEIAHSDIDILELSISLFEGGHGAIHREIRSPFQRNILKSILKMIEKHDRAFESHCEQLREELPLGVWM